MNTFKWTIPEPQHPKMKKEITEYRSTGSVKTRFNEGNIGDINRGELNRMLACMLTAKATKNLEFQLTEQRYIDSLYQLIGQKERDRNLFITQVIAILIGFPIAFEGVWRIINLILGTE
jgi:hypothetical protein